MIANTLKDINVDFDMQTDSHDKDPDYASATLKSYHRLLWSKPLPNGEVMVLETGKGMYLKYKDIYLGSDSITATFRNGRNKNLEAFKQGIDNFPNFEEKVLSKLYTIGGSIIFPQTKYSMNRARGCHPRICDRWDLSLECIRRYYNGEESPLMKAIEESKGFFKLFIDFKGYVDFFFLQDCVDKDYNVKLWLKTPLFVSYPLPMNLEDYRAWIDTQMDFTERRNQRIKEYCRKYL